MIYCRTCGQCPHVDDEWFVEFAYVSGSETRFINPDTGDVEDYGDSNVEGTGESEYECPYCQGSDIEFNSNVSAEDALNTRAAYEASQAERSRILQEAIQIEKIEKSDWDLVTN